MQTSWLQAEARSLELKALLKAGEEQELSLQQEVEATRALASKAEPG